MAQRSPAEQSTIDWDRLYSWASDNGIPSSAVIPVEQLNQSRISQGYEPMSIAEATRGIAAANNPNNVITTPSDQASAWDVFSNARNDFRSIMTGLDPIKWPSEIKSMVGDTLSDLASGNIHGLLTNSVFASFLPYVYDVGLLTQYGLSPEDLVRGLGNLAQHPLIGLLDLVPEGASGALARGGARLGYGADVLDRLGMTPEQFKAATAKQIVMAMPTAGQGIDLATGRLLGTKEAPMTIGATLQNWVARTPLPLVKPIQRLLGSINVTDERWAAVHQEVTREASVAWAKLTPEDASQVLDILTKNDRQGISLDQQLSDPAVPLTVRDAIDKLMGVQRFIYEQGLFNGDIEVMREADGTLRVAASGKVDPEVVAARNDLRAKTAAAMEQVGEADLIMRSMIEHENALPGITDKVRQSNTIARGQLTQDAALLENLKSSYQGTDWRGRPQEQVHVYGQKRDAASQLFGAGGLIDRMLERLDAKDYDTAGEMARIIQGRLRRWGALSVDAAANPAFVQVAAQIDGLVRWAKTYEDSERSVRAMLEGKRRVVPHEVAQRETQFRRESSALDAQHNTEKAQLKAGHDAKQEKINARAAFAIFNARRDGEGQLALLRERLENETYRASDEVRAMALQREALQEHSITAWRDEGIDQANAIAERDNAKANADYDTARQALAERQRRQRQQMTDRHEAAREFDGPLARALREYGEAQTAFVGAVFDHPADNWRNVETEVFNNRLMAHSQRRVLDRALTQKLSAQLGRDVDLVAEYHENAVLLAQEMRLMTQDVYRGPTSPAWLEPELEEPIRQIVDEVRRSAALEITRLRGLGYKPEWYGTVLTFDRPEGVRPDFSYGKPDVEIAHERKEGLTGQRYGQFFLGLSNEAARTLTRDAWEETVHQHFEPHVQTRGEVEGFLRRIDAPRAFNLTEGDIVAHFQSAVAKLGLVRFEPDKLFGISRGRFAGEELYIPRSIYKAVESMRKEQGRPIGTWDEATNVFRTSILGLSPRYTAHVTFGGALMLALRSTPYLHTYMRDAARAVKEGTIPMEAFKYQTFEGAMPLQEGLNALQYQAGRAGALIGLRERVAKLGDYQPVKLLKAAADANYHFTRYVTNLYSAMAYLDYAKRAERRGYFLDESTGEVRTMTKARAMEEGIHHVAEVFGDLRQMTGWERYFARRIMPFYGWQKHVLKYVLTLPADHPYRATVLGLVAYDDIEQIPKGLPARAMEYLFMFGEPNADGQVMSVDLRFLDPFRDTASYASIGGWLSALNPILLAPIAQVDPSIIYGSTPLYPNVSFDPYYGIDVAGTQGGGLTALEQFIPQVGGLASAFDLATHYRQLGATGKAALYNQVTESFNVPFLPQRHASVRQMAAADAIDRYHVAYDASQNALETGDFAQLAGYSSVPNPLNPDYEMSVGQLEALYRSAAIAYPALPPAETLVPPPTPPGL